MSSIKQLAIWIMALMILFSVNNTEARTITVDKIKKADHSSIQDAVNNANTGDTILVQPGTYFESLSIDKSLIIKGLSPDQEKPLLHAKNNNFTIVIKADDVTIDGFRITNTVSNSVQSIFIEYSGTGILVLGNNTILRNNTLWNNVNGIVLRNSQNNTIISNTVTNSLQSIIIEYSDNNLLSDNILSKNTGGIDLRFSSNNIIKSNSFLNNKYGAIEFAGNSGNNLIYNNLFNVALPIGSWSENVINNFSIVKTQGTNIAGSDYLGGNVWSNPDGYGYSENCDDNDRNGFCDSPYVIQNSHTTTSIGIDYLPLVYKPASTNYSDIFHIVSIILGVVSVLAAVYLKRKELRIQIYGFFREIFRGIIGMLLGAVIGIFLGLILSLFLGGPHEGRIGDFNLLWVCMEIGGFAGLVGGLSRDALIAAIFSAICVLINTYSTGGVLPNVAGVVGIIIGIVFGFAIFGAKNDSRQGAIYGGMVTATFIDALTGIWVSKVIVGDMVEGSAAINGLSVLSLLVTGSILGGFFLGRIINKIRANKIIIHYMMAGSIAGFIGGIATGIYIGLGEEIESSIIGVSYGLILLIPVAGAVCGGIGGIFIGKRKCSILYTVLSGAIVGALFSLAGFALYELIGVSLPDRMGDSVDIFPLIFGSIFGGFMSWIIASILRGKMEGGKK